MKDEGYTWCDLRGELMAQGIDPDEVSTNTLLRHINEPTAERCAKAIKREDQENR